ncbi:MAG TPA: hypothetical protein DDZ89_18980, partial [Clostridiales bacterium]|nr:hypothetical protein [Clostridiales bacterium]
VIKLTIGNRVIAQSDGNTLLAGIKNNIDLPVTKTPASLDVWVVDREGNPIKLANVNIFMKSTD